jgi:hypothetical protein
MKRLLFIFSFLIISNNCFSQPPVQLHLKKNGHIKKRIQIGDEILAVTKQDEIFKGNIFKLTKDSISFRFATIALSNISSIKFSNNKKGSFSFKGVGWATFGVALVTTGLVAAGWKEFPEALGIAAAIGYTPYLFQLVKLISFKKYKFKIGKRYTILVWDIR